MCFARGRRKLGAVAKEIRRRCTDTRLEDINGTKWERRKESVVTLITSRPRYVRAWRHRKLQARKMQRQWIQVWAEDDKCSRKHQNGQRTIGKASTTSAMLGMRAVGNGTLGPSARPRRTTTPWLSLFAEHEYVMCRQPRGDAVVGLLLRTEDSTQPKIS